MEQSWNMEASASAWTPVVDGLSVLMQAGGWIFDLGVQSSGLVAVFALAFGACLVAFAGMHRLFGRAPAPAAVPAPEASALADPAEDPAD